MTNSNAISLTAIMLTDGIQKIERTAGRFHVVLTDGRSGVGGNVREALDKAFLPTAINTLKAA